MIFIFLPLDVTFSIIHRLYFSWVVIFRSGNGKPGIRAIFRLRFIDFGYRSAYLKGQEVNGYETKGGVYWAGQDWHDFVF